MSIHTLGWLGLILLVSAGFPQLTKVIRAGHAKGMAWWYLILLVTGMLFMTIFSFLNGAAIQFRLGYSIQLVVWTIIIGVKIYGSNWGRQD